MRTRPMVKRNSRSAVHHIAQAPRYGYGCGVTERQVHERSGGASADWERVTCEACLDRMPFDDWSACAEYKDCACGGAKRGGIVHTPQDCGREKCGVQDTD
jgi:hypothetical protein